MAILAIDSSTGPCSVAIWKDGAISSYVENLKPVMQSASLVPMIEDALRQSCINYSDLCRIATTTGPGSFTGIRVGLASARGIGFAAAIPVSGFTTLDVLAYAARGQKNAVISILSAGKGEYYYQCFGAGMEPLFAPRLGALEEALATVTVPATVAGNVEITAEGFSHCGIIFPRADALAELAAGTTASQEAKPFYIRPPDAKLPIKII